MASRNDDNKILRCSFCNKTQDQVRKLIAGPGAYICDECVGICSDIIEDELKNIALRTSKVLDCKIDLDAALELAMRSRGTPRICNRSGSSKEGSCRSCI